jgi:chromosome partitioning protein
VVFQFERVGVDKLEKSTLDGMKIHRGHLERLLGKRLCLAETGAETLQGYAQGINGGRPEGRLVLNKMKTHDTISRELRDNAPKLGLQVASCVIRDLQAFRDAAQQGTVVGRFGRKGLQAAADMDALFTELVGEAMAVKRQAGRQKVENG